jgi:hypothetical protein
MRENAKAGVRISADVLLSLVLLLAPASANAAGNATSLSDAQAAIETNMLHAMSWFNLKWRSGVLRQCRFRPFGAGIFKA